ncbi:hypothetical protein [Paraburkholderia diazotrophica]|uniref:Uncharacterized protein n=1 Tax=Paraburkholderia diazotrophica TaxID=667676 RepID=A0A1H7CMC4_9BURK|nr:hypothetical protein [Paraburkholderia diazotrophica]SEJ90923.1 hypothetical protein SAMN05192539_102314 [Paraburkholderia diazotrophica]
MKGPDESDEKLTHDLNSCLSLISYAANHGKKICDADVAVVLRASEAHHGGHHLNSEDLGECYAAMSRIAQAVAPVTAESIKEENKRAATREVTLYQQRTISLAVVVVLLSVALLTMNRLSDEIANLVKENDATALVIHNELQGYILTIDDSKLAAPGGHNLLVNSPASIELKEHLQKFARNNRQLYSDMMYLNKIWTYVSYLPRMLLTLSFSLGPDVKERNRYAPGCKEYNPEIYTFVIDPVPFEKYPSYMRGTHSATQYLFIVRPLTHTRPWMCDPDDVRKALEVKLPLLRVGSVDPDDQLDSWPPEMDVQEGFRKIAVYQDIRGISLPLSSEVETYAGAISGFLLPILYALLGACACIFRDLRVSVVEDTYHAKSAKTAQAAHFISASIVGITIGLFEKSLEGGKELSPLAIAFIGGYASDEFFGFIDRVVGSMFPPKKP